MANSKRPAKSSSYESQVLSKRKIVKRRTKSISDFRNIKKPKRAGSECTDKTNGSDSTEVTPDMVASILHTLPPEPRATKMYDGEVNKISWKFEFSEPMKERRDSIHDEVIYEEEPQTPLPLTVHRENAIQNTPTISHNQQHNLQHRERSNTYASDMSIHSGPESPGAQVSGEREIADIRHRRERRKHYLRQNTTGPRYGARAVKLPADQPFRTGLDRPLVELVQDGGPALSSLHLRKLEDATNLLQSTGIHVLEPLTLYTKIELYEIMASIAEAWKNSGKAAWKKRINKIKGNARSRKPPRNVLDEKEIEEIELLERKIRERKEWEQQEKQKLEKQMSLSRE
eukprot:CAMPEP_0203753522 /NCGR_PEP_ID=MMETSP0098-20131031/7282_1 /ASSEMBLY_ACC=CAM_ASM_000208 /TAXON_ID=96639 /ORGANISM=" , Strain NY0313808BC1" /LENGTH=342 /DNA_ID=CAMNT_0050644159 /DNA_START=481 /DNA_END=1509 /DNA_ORIENTATION=-